MHVRELQTRILEVGTEVWGVENATNPQERLFRLTEEFLELIRASGLSFTRLSEMACREYFDRKKGEVPQEVAGALMTLLAFSNAHGIDAEAVAVQEIVRLLANKEEARAKHAAKPLSTRAA